MNFILGLAYALIGYYAAVKMARSYLHLNANTVYGNEKLDYVIAGVIAIGSYFLWPLCLIVGLFYLIGKGIEKQHERQKYGRYGR